MSVYDIYISLSDFTEDWDGREVWEGGNMGMPMAFLLIYDRKPQNSVK